LEVRKQRSLAPPPPIPSETLLLPISEFPEGWHETTEISGPHGNHAVRWYWDDVTENDKKKSTFLIIDWWKDIETAKSDYLRGLKARPIEPGAVRIEGLWRGDIAVRHPDEYEFWSLIPAEPETQRAECLYVARYDTYVCMFYIRFHLDTLTAEQVKELVEKLDESFAIVDRQHDTKEPE